MQVTPNILFAPGLAPLEVMREAILGAGLAYCPPRSQHTMPGETRLRWAVPPPFPGVVSLDLWLRCHRVKTPVALRFGAQDDPGAHYYSFCGDDPIPLVAYYARLMEINRLLRTPLGEAALDLAREV